MTGTKRYFNQVNITRTGGRNVKPDKLKLEIRDNSF